MLEKIGQDGSLSDRVAEEVLRYILDNQLTEGDRLPNETTLSEKLNVGRSTIREAMKLLASVMTMVASKGYAVGNADVTIVAQRPKLAEYMAQMRRRLAEGLHVDLDRVNVKATTTERMGFEGEELGISAQATVLLYGREGVR